jgi:hypothetical protein
MTVSGSSETMVSTHKNTACHNPGDYNLKNNSCAEIILVPVETVAQLCFFCMSWILSPVNTTSKQRKILSQGFFLIDVLALYIWYLA